MGVRVTLVAACLVMGACTSEPIRGEGSAPSVEARGQEDALDPVQQYLGDVGAVVGSAVGDREEVLALGLGFCEDHSLGVAAGDAHDEVMTRSIAAANQQVDAEVEAVIMVYLAAVGLLCPEFWGDDTKEYEDLRREIGLEEQR